MEDRWDAGRLKNSEWIAIFKKETIEQSILLSFNLSILWPELLSKGKESMLIKSEDTAKLEGL